MFGAPSLVISNGVGALDRAVDALPLDAIEVESPAFVDYDAATESYSDVETFSIFFSANAGILADR